MAAGFAAAAVIANLFPFEPRGNTFALTVLHLPIALWLLVGIAYTRGGWRESAGRMDFVRFSGEMLIYNALIALGGGGTRYDCNVRRGRHEQRPTCCPCWKCCIKPKLRFASVVQYLRATRSKNQEEDHSRPEAHTSFQQLSIPNILPEGLSMHARFAKLLSTFAAVFLSACATSGGAVAPIDIDPSVRGPVAGVGIEGQDIISMTDRMMRDMLGSPDLARRPVTPRVIIDAEYFQNDSSQIINKNAITDRLRVNLNRASQGRMSFVGRQYAGMVAKERDLKRQGVTDAGTTGLTRAQAGADFRLGGRIATVDSRNPKTGLQQRYTQITFSMVDLESGMLIWEGMYEFSRASADDIIYR